MYGVARESSTRKVVHRDRSGSSVRPARHSFQAGENTGGTVQLKLVVLGATKVGKSALASQFLWSYFPIEYHPTVEEFNWIEYDVSETGNECENDKALLLEVIDTSGSRDFLAMRNLYVSTGDAFVVVFSLDCPSSFDEAKAIIADIRSRNLKDAPILLIANKLDVMTERMKNNWTSIEEYLQQEHLLFANLSARDTSAVEMTFGRLLERLRNRRCAGRPVLTKRRQSMPAKQFEVDYGNIQVIERKDSNSRCVLN